MMTWNLQIVNFLKSSNNLFNSSSVLIVDKIWKEKTYESIFEI